jgi:hypothetical protein
MTVRWRYLDASANETGWSEEFAAQGDAEAWLSERWAELADSGVDAVELVDDGREVFRMSLRPAADA